MGIKETGGQYGLNKTGVPGGMGILLTRLGAVTVGRSLITLPGDQVVALPQPPTARWHGRHRVPRPTEPAEQGPAGPVLVINRFPGEPRANQPRSRRFADSRQQRASPRRRQDRRENADRASSRLCPHLPSPDCWPAGHHSPGGEPASVTGLADDDRSDYRSTPKFSGCDRRVAVAAPNEEICA